MTSARVERPLSGRRVVVTRARAQAVELVEALEALGAEVVVAPAIRITEPSDGGAALRSAVSSLVALQSDRGGASGAMVGQRGAVPPSPPSATASGGLVRTEWIVFTSANAVRRFAAAWDQVVVHDEVTGGDPLDVPPSDRTPEDGTAADGASGDGAVGDQVAGGGAVEDRVAAGGISSGLILPARPAGARVAAIGSGTGDSAREVGLAVDLVPRQFVAEALLAEFPAPDRSSGRVLLPRAEVARDVLPEGLRRLGWTVEVVPAYRTVPTEPDESLRGAVAGADAVCVASASAARAFIDAFGPDIPAVVAAIGPVTARAVRERGVEVAVEPTVHTIDAMVAALGEHFATRCPP